MEGANSVRWVCFNQLANRALRTELLDRFEASSRRGPRAKVAESRGPQVVAQRAGWLSCSMQAPALQVAVAAVDAQRRLQTSKTAATRRRKPVAWSSPLIAALCSVSPSHPNPGPPSPLPYCCVCTAPLPSPPCPAVHFDTPHVPCPHLHAWPPIAPCVRRGWAPSACAYPEQESA